MSQHLPMCTTLQSCPMLSLVFSSLGHKATTVFKLHHTAVSSQTLYMRIVISALLLDVHCQVSVTSPGVRRPPIDLNYFQSSSCHSEGRMKRFFVMKVWEGCWKLQKELDWPLSAN